MRGVDKTRLYAVIKIRTRITKGDTEVMGYQADMSEYKYLGKINSPEELAAYSDSDMPLLCGEIRDFLVRQVSENGGHLASNLGVVELSVAIHRNFNCPHDHIIFDVGHQSYVHKMLTGRFDRFGTLRQGGGISGFTKRSESEYDCFGAGHSSTSLSAALGFAEADKLSGSDAYTVVVLGDGAFTGGMVHEALNNCRRDLRLIIILNENEMSISKNIGRFARNISRLRRKSGYFRAKRVTSSVLMRIPLVGKYIFRVLRKVKKAAKNALYGSNYFEDMGLYYLGPADGNKYEDVDALLREAKKANESVIIHVKTQKGKGYTPAEKDPRVYHGIKPSDSAMQEVSFSRTFGECLTELARSDKSICAITAAMSAGTGLDVFESEFPERFFDVGIAEEHAVTFACGLSASGYKPVFAVYSTFLQRAYDQVIHDAALQGLPLVLAVDRAGLNSSDGATHHGIFDVAFLSQIPNVDIYAPVTYGGLRESIKRALASGRVCAVRYPSGSEQRIILDTFYPRRDFDNIGVRSDCEGHADILFVTHGRIASECLKAKQCLNDRGITSAVVLCEYIRPYERLAEDVRACMDRHTPRAIVFVEEEIKSGGFGMMLSECMRDIGALDGVSYCIAAPYDTFVIQERSENIYKSAGVDFETLARMGEELINK